MRGTEELDGGRRAGIWVLQRAKCRFAFRLHVQTALRDLHPSTLQVNQQLSRTNRAKEQTQKEELDVELKDYEHLAIEQAIVCQMPYSIFVTPDSLSSSTNTDIQQTYPHHILPLGYEKPNEQLEIMPPRTSTQTS